MHYTLWLPFVVASAVSAQFLAANLTRPFTNAAEASGPFDAFYSYPLYKATDYPKTAGYMIGGANSAVNYHYHSWNVRQATLTGRIPVYVIYYGDVTQNQKNHVNNFIRNIGSDSAWRIVHSYGGGTPYYADSIHIACGTNGYSCQLNQFKEQELLNTLFHRHSSDLKRSSNAIYTFVLGDNVQYTFSQKNGDGKYINTVMGAGQLCGTHDIAEIAQSVYPYVTVQLTKTEQSACNVLKNVGYPNGRANFTVDNMIGILFHELVETVLPNYDDDDRLQIADKCANRFVGIDGNSNVDLGGRKYLIPPLWDNWGWYCSMGESFLIRSEIRTDFCINAAGSDLRMSGCSSGTSRRFHFGPNRSLVAAGTNLCMAASGTAVFLSTCNGSAAQQWYYNPADKSMRPVLADNRCLAVASSSNNADLRLEVCNKSLSQQFITNTLSSAPSNVFVNTFANARFCITWGSSCVQASGAYGTPVRMETCDGQSDQVFAMVFKNGIMTTNRGFCFNADANNEVTYRHCDKDSVYQQWNYNPVDRSIRVIGFPQKCLEVPMNSRRGSPNGLNLRMATCNGSENQRFNIA